MQGIQLPRQPFGIAAARHRYDIGCADDLGFLRQSGNGEDRHVSILRG
jgi:hypothetical protein